MEMEGSDKSKGGDDKWTQPKGLIISKRRQKQKEQAACASQRQSDRADGEMNKSPDGVGDNNSQPLSTRVRDSPTEEEMETDADLQLKRDLEWAGICPISNSSSQEDEIVESSGSEEELEDYAIDQEDPTKLCTVNNKKNEKLLFIPDRIEAYNQDDEITLVGDEDGEDSFPKPRPLIDPYFIPRSPTRPGSSKSVSNVRQEPISSIDHDSYYPPQWPQMSAEAIYRQSELERQFLEDQWADMPVETDENGTIGAVIAGRSHKRDLPSPILREHQYANHSSIDEVQAFVQGHRQRSSWQQTQTRDIEDAMFQGEVLLVPGVNECTVGNMEAILDSMKNCCGSSQHFRMVESLEIALRRCRPGCRIFVGCGEHPISSLGVIGQSGGQISGPHAGYGQAVISPRLSDHVWLNVMRSSEVSMENVTVLLDKVNFSSAGAGDFIPQGPSVGFLVQGALRLHNAIITTKLNDNAENPSRPITGIELTERASLYLQRSTMKHCSVGLVVQNEAETEINEATITNCVIGIQSAFLGKNYIKDMAILHSNNYAVMVDSETQFGEGTVDNLKEEESFYIENVKIKDCTTEVYFIGVEPQSSSSGSGSDRSGGSLNKTK